MNVRKVILKLVLVCMVILVFPAGALAPTGSSDVPVMVSGARAEENLMNTTSAPLSDSSSQTKLDLAIVFDDTGSLSDEIAGMKAKVNELTDSISSADIDCRYSLISFKDTVSVKQRWTSDPTVIKKAVDCLYASGGDDEPEADLDAVEAALDMDFRPDAHHIILDITDEITHYKDDGTVYSNYTIPETATHLMSKGINYFLIGPASVQGSFDSQNDKRELVRALGGNGLFFDIHSSDFSIILERFQKIITETYTKENLYPNSSLQGNTSIINIKVGSEADSGQYGTSVSDLPVISGSGITPDNAARRTTVPVTISGNNFRSGAIIRLFKDSYSINLIESSITSSSISGTFDIPSDAPAGLYTVEVTNPDGKTGYGYDMFTITPTGSSSQQTSTSRSGDISNKDLLNPSDLQEDEAVTDDECEGWEVNSGYYLVERVVDTNSPVYRIQDPWCWCNGFPYNKNYQTCVPMNS